jgi:hypothetical protein
MKQIITLNTFRAAFENAGRGNQFTYEGLEALLNYFEEIESDAGIELSLDVIGICCEFCEYANLQEITNEYPSIKTLENLEDNTQVIQFNSGIIIQNF